MREHPEISFCHSVGKVVPAAWQSFANGMARLCHADGTGKNGFKEL